MARQLILGCVLACLTTVAASAGDVFVKTDGGEHGVGLGRLHQGACHVITPRHVVMDRIDDALDEGDGGAGFDESPWISRPGIRVVAENRSEARATVTFHSRDVDLAVLTVDTDRPATFCPAARWPESDEVAGKLKSAGSETARSGTLQVRREDGALEIVPIQLESVFMDYLVFSPQRDEDRITKGMSGSALRLAGLPVGMLLTTEGDQSRALRLDTINLLTVRIFRRELVNTALQAAFRELSANPASRDLTPVDQVRRWRAFLDEFGRGEATGEADARALADARDQLFVWQKIADGRPEDEVLRVEAEQFLKYLDDGRYHEAYGRFTRKARDVEPFRAFHARARGYLLARPPEIRPRACTPRPAGPFNRFAAAEGQRSVYCVFTTGEVTFIEDVFLERQASGRWLISSFFVDTGEVYP
jgi:hypothetical protein